MVNLGKIHKNHKNKKRRSLYKHLIDQVWKGKILNLNKNTIKINKIEIITINTILIKWKYINYS